jgi:hypothetical protein
MVDLRGVELGGVTTGGCLFLMGVGVEISLKNASSEIGRRDAMFGSSHIYGGGLRYGIRQVG